MIDLQTLKVGRSADRFGFPAHLNPQCARIPPCHRSDIQVANHLLMQLPLERNKLWIRLGF
jgi:hypothetical protein